MFLTNSKPKHVLAKQLVAAHEIDGKTCKNIEMKLQDLGACVDPKEEEDFDAVLGESPQELALKAENEDWEMKKWKIRHENDSGIAF